MTRLQFLWYAERVLLAAKLQPFFITTKYFSLFFIIIFVVRMGIAPTTVIRNNTTRPCHTLYFESQPTPGS